MLLKPVGIMSGPFLGSGAVNATNLGNTMTPGAGFLVYVFADNNYDGTDDLPKTLSVGGSENSGNVTYPVSGSIDANQYGLSGNPYYTTIDWDDVTKNNVDGYGLCLQRCQKWWGRLH